jgi:hypothetical protein
MGCSFVQLSNTPFSKTIISFGPPVVPIFTGRAKVLTGNSPSFGNPPVSCDGHLGFELNRHQLSLYYHFYFSFRFVSDEHELRAVGRSGDAFLPSLSSTLYDRSILDLPRRS